VNSSQIKRFAFAHACERVRLREGSARGGREGRIVGWTSDGLLVALEDGTGWKFSLHTLGATRVFFEANIAAHETGWVVGLNDIELIEKG